MPSALAEPNRFRESICTAGGSASTSDDGTSGEAVPIVGTAAKDAVDVALSPAVGLASPVAPTVWAGSAASVAPALGLAALVGLAVPVALGLGVSAGFAVPVALGLGVSAGFAVPVALGLGVSVGLAVSVAPALGLGVTGLGVFVGGTVSVAPALGLGVAPVIWAIWSRSSLTCACVASRASVLAASSCCALAISTSISAIWPSSAAISAASAPESPSVRSAI